MQGSSAYQTEEEHLLVRAEGSMGIQRAILGDFLCGPLGGDSRCGAELLDELQMRLAARSGRGSCAVGTFKQRGLLQHHCKDRRGRRGGVRRGQAHLF